MVEIMDINLNNSSTVSGLNNKVDLDLNNSNIKELLNNKYDKSGGEITNSIFGHTNNWESSNEDEFGNLHTNSFVKIIGDKLSFNKEDSESSRHNLICLYTKDGKELCGIQGGIAASSDGITTYNTIMFYVYNNDGSKTNQLIFRNNNRTNESELVDYKYKTNKCIRLMNGIQIVSENWGNYLNQNGRGTITFEYPFKDTNYQVFLSIRSGLDIIQSPTVRFEILSNSSMTIQTYNTEGNLVGGIAGNYLCIGYWK